MLKRQKKVLKKISRLDDVGQSEERRKKREVCIARARFLCQKRFWEPFFVRIVFVAMMMMGQCTRTKKATFGSAFVIRALCFAIGVARLSGASGKCIASNDAIESFFANQIDSANPPELPTSGSCCQMDICALPCPAEVPKPADSFGIGVICVVVLFCCIGVGTVYFVGGKAKNFFVAGRTLPLPVVILTLASQSIDSNALLGNADLSYKFAFFDGAVLPIGLGLSLLLNALFFAKKMNTEGVLTLPDVYGKRYGVATEIIASMVLCCSFLCLLAGNLVGMAKILSYLFQLDITDGVFLSGIIILIYTACGGLFSVAYTDVIQSAVGMTGCLAAVYWIITNAEEKAPPPSIGFPDYVYPNEAIAKMYDGVPCTNVADSWCYNATKWDGVKSDAGAYPYGDKVIYDKTMSDPQALTPFPNAILFNWATIFVLGFGNLAALDFQARCLAAKTPKTAQIGCIVAGLLTFLVGIPFAYTGAATRYYYGPDSPHAEFIADTCSPILGLPTCAKWNPDPNAFIYMLTHVVPKGLGGWCLLGIVAASMSTCDGAILALGTVFSHNIVRHFPGGMVKSDNLLRWARISTIPFAFIAMGIAAAKSDTTGYLLVVAFDTALAGAVVPLFAAFYVKDPSPNAAFWSIFAGSLCRVILEFSLKKDGNLIYPYGGDEFLDYGTAATDLFPTFFDKPKADLWDPSVQECKQTRLEDWTGVDSLVSPAVSLLVFTILHVVEKTCGAVSCFPKSWFTPLEKNFDDDDDADVEMK